MPQSQFVIKGDIQDFTRLDNLYNSLKREATKLLTNWEMTVDVKYTEKQEEQKE